MDITKQHTDEKPVAINNSAVDRQDPSRAGLGRRTFRMAIASAFATLLVMAVGMQPAAADRAGTQSGPNGILQAAVTRVGNNLEIAWEAEDFRGDVVGFTVTAIDDFGNNDADFAAGAGGEGVLVLPYEGNTSIDIVTRFTYVLIPSRSNVGNPLVLTWP